MPKYHSIKVEKSSYRELRRLSKETGKPIVRIIRDFLKSPKKEEAANVAS